MKPQSGEVWEVELDENNQLTLFRKLGMIDQEAEIKKKRE